MASEEVANQSAVNGAEEPLFDVSLKKKSKKKVVDFDLDGGDANGGASTDAPAPVEDAAEAEENLDDMFGALKKKKKKKAIPMDLDEEAVVEPAADATAADAGVAAADAVPDGDLDFGEMKKKKKKGGKKGGFDLEAFEKELGEGSAAGGGGVGGDDEDGADDDADVLGDDPFSRDEGAADKGDEKEQAETWLGTDRDYTYQELVGRIFSTLRAQNPALSVDKKKYTIVPPVVQRDGAKKTMFANVIEISKRMRRQPDHVMQYLFSELGTDGSLDGNQRLVIRGRFQPAQIEKVLRKYIVEYVTCKTCRSPSTTLTKENRIYFMTCVSCGSTRSVTTIKTGFQAQTGKRSKTRAQAT